MAKKRRSAIEEFLALSPEEKEREYRAVDREFSRAETKPLTPQQRKAWKKFRERRRSRGRPKVGEGAKVVSLTIEGGLLKRTDALAKREGVSRAQLVARGLEMLLRASRCHARREAQADPVRQHRAWEPMLISNANDALYNGKSAENESHRGREAECRAANAPYRP